MKQIDTSLLKDIVLQNLLKEQEEADEEYIDDSGEEETALDTQQPGNTEPQQPVNTVATTQTQVQKKKTNLGNGIEFYVALELFLQFRKLFPKKSDVAVEAPQKLKTFRQKGEKAIGGKKELYRGPTKRKITNLTKVRREAKAFAESYVNSFYVKNEFLSHPLKKIQIYHIGNDEAGISSGDVKIEFFYKEAIEKDGKSVLGQTHKISLKRGNNAIYRTSNYKSLDIIDDKTTNQQILDKLKADTAFYGTDEYNEKLKEVIKSVGYGPRKVFNIFGYIGDDNFERQIRTLAIKQNNAIVSCLTTDEKTNKLVPKSKNDENFIKAKTDFENARTEKNSVIRNYFNNFYPFLQQQFSGEKIENKKILQIFNIIHQLTSRSDEEVYSLVELNKFSAQNFNEYVFFPKLLDQYIGHIKNINISRPKKSTEHPAVEISIGNVIPFSAVKDERTIQKSILPLFIEIGNNLRELQSQESLKKKTNTNQSNILLNTFGLQEIDFNNKSLVKLFLKKIVDRANFFINSIKNEKILTLKYSFSRRKFESFLDLGSNYRKIDILKQEGSEMDNVSFNKNKGFKKFAAFLNGLYALQHSENEFVKKTLNSLNKLLFVTSQPEENNSNSEDNIKEYVIRQYRNFLLKENKENIINKIKEKINDLEKEELGIISVTPSNKSEAAIVVRCKEKENIPNVRKKVKNSLNDLGFSIRNRVIAKFEPSTESTEIDMGDGSGGVYVVYKYDTGSREGLALEHIVGMLLTKKATPELKNRLDLPPEASVDEIKDKLESDYSDVLKTALEGKSLVDQKIGQIKDARSEGSRNSKADLILTTVDGHTYGLSIKLVTEEGREVRFTYNKNLGYGDDEEDTLVKSPNGKPWWLIGRRMFAKKLGRQFKGNAEELEPPSWMVKAKESKSDLYKEAMEDTYALLRKVFVNNLKKMKLKDLVSMVNEAHNGGEQEENYEKLFVLTSDVEGIRLEEKGHEEPDIEKIKMSGMNKSDIIKTDGARIIIDIPGMSPLTIHGLKFHSNMLSSNREDLKIKTR